MYAGTLYKAIAAVCPITATAVGDENDRATWSFTAESTATPEQIAAAKNVIATISPEGEPRPTVLMSKRKVV